MTLTIIDKKIKKLLPLFSKGARPNGTVGVAKFRKNFDGGFKIKFENKKKGFSNSPISLP